MFPEQHKVHTSKNTIEVLKQICVNIENVDAHPGPSPHTTKENYQNIFGRTMANT